MDLDNDTRSQAQEEEEEESKVVVFDEIDTPNDSNYFVNHRYYTRSKAQQKALPNQDKTPNSVNNTNNNNNNNNNKQRNNQQAKSENVTLVANAELSKCYTLEPLTELELSQFKCIFNPVYVCINII